VRTIQFNLRGLVIGLSPREKIEKLEFALKRLLGLFAIAVKRIQCDNAQKTTIVSNRRYFQLTKVAET
jgi:hypothetical protein